MVIESSTITQASVLWPLPRLTRVAKEAPFIIEGWSCDDPIRELFATRCLAEEAFELASLNVPRCLPCYERRLPRTWPPPYDNPRVSHPSPPCPHSLAVRTCPETPVCRVNSSAPSPVSDSPPMHDDSDEEEFVYPGASDTPSPPPEPEEQPAAEPTPPRAGTPTPEPLVHTQPAQSLVSSKAHPSPAQLEALHAAAASGDLRRVQTEFRKAVRADDVEPFELANDASPRTGLTALHAAASRGWLDIVKWRTCSFVLMQHSMCLSGRSAVVKSSRSAVPFLISRTRRAR